MSSTTTKDAPAGSAGALDTAKLGAAVLAVVAGIVGYYWFSGLPIVVRVLMVIAGVAAAAGLVYWTALGRELWAFMQGSRVELRKVVWPTRQETQQTTLTVVVFVLVLGVFFWGLDFVLLLITRAVTGQAG
jgi:preprotein translocase subunit SecE